MPPEPRRPILEVPPTAHGGLDYDELQRMGLQPDDVLDFSANTNPYGPSPAVREAVRSVSLERYPDREALALRATLSDSLGVSAGRILAGNGASELIWLAALAFVRPGDDALVIGPTYGEYARAVKLMGGRVNSLQARAADDFQTDAADVADQLGRPGPRLAFVCSPNNPTGTALNPETLVALAHGHPRTLFVVDEAYLLFAGHLGSVLGLPAENLLVLRSLTKDCALAGVRLGYAVGAEPVIEAMRRVQPPWSVSAVAQAAGVAALGDPAHRAGSLQLLQEAKGELVAGLARLGLRPLPSAVPFFLVRAGNGSDFRRALLKRRVLVRDCASFGLPAYVRICTRRPEENERLLAAVREVV